VILVDSDVLIAHLRGRERARAWLEEARTSNGPLSVSVVSIAEIAGRMRSAERREVRRLFASLRTYPVSNGVAWKAAEMMRSFSRSHSGIGLGNYLVAATAETQGLGLATLNTRHYPMFPDLEPAFPI